jgi:large subunit ribosomal protein L10
MKDLLIDQVVLMYSDDPVTAAKISVEFSKKNEKLEIVGGAMGSKVLDAKGVVEVSKMPSRDEILSSISGLLTSPGGSLVSQFNRAGSDIASVLAEMGENR